MQWVYMQNLLMQWYICKFVVKCNMPLFVGRRKVQHHDINSLEKFMESFPQLEKTSKGFALEEPTKFDGKKILYIGQREYGTVAFNDDLIDVIGSDSATTCQIVVIRHEGTGDCSLTHLDGASTKQALKDMIGSLEALAQNRGQRKRYQLHIVGGFLDSRRMSENFFMMILSVVMNFSVDVDLVCARVCGVTVKSRCKMMRTSYNLYVYVT
ncbi:protein N-terminal asparagine amidohydrolase-like [Xenia sp. Carnegie-2017]|uniref:protein N-terminal asparagine amidohydrolase-like n=1 Tax=Xenia sp. Carnegie-2017 TaxID=2897299 RepID=UPI001F03ABC7|nr:protein N-terminal asparagine amidohydrolase-like [Xenia sp. Carnegie-2017]